MVQQQPVADDLEKIDGIGAAIAPVLVAAGITTYAELAKRKEGELRKIVQDGGVKANVEPAKWISEARQLINSGQALPLDLIYSSLVQISDGYRFLEPIFGIAPPRFALDEFAQRAVDSTKERFKSFVDQVPQKIGAGGLSPYIMKVTKKLNEANLDETTELLLSIPGVYQYLIEVATAKKGDVIEIPVEDRDPAVEIKDASGENIKPEDTTALYNSVLRNVKQKIEPYFTANLLREALDYSGVALDESRQKSLLSVVRERGLPVRVGKVEQAIHELLERVNAEGAVPALLDTYITEGNGTRIRKTLYTPAIRRAMINHLVKSGVDWKKVKSNEVKNGSYDEYFALAYNNAQRVSAVSEDPIDAARIKGSVTEWDFTVDTFDTIEEQGVIPANIRAAGALDYVHYIGDVLRVFDVADALVLRWASGELDVTDGSNAAALYRYYKLRDERTSREERDMEYKRILNKGNGRVLSRMVVNEAFPSLWDSLMSEVAEYIRRSEQNDPERNAVSRAPIYQATRELQYNLSEYMIGMAHLQVTEMYAHLQEAVDLIKSEDILDHFGGRRKNMWMVIERIAKEEMGFAPPTSQLRTLAIAGNKAFQWIADFNQETYKEEEFKAFLEAAEAWIIARAALEPSVLEDEDQEDIEDQEDEFADWED